MKTRIMKTVGVVLAAVMCLGMTAFAAPSPSATGAAGVVSAVDANGNAVNVTVSSTFTAAEQTAVNTLRTTDGLRAALGNAYTAGMTVVDVKEVTSDVLPVTITFSIPGVTANSKGMILHWNGSSWEQMKTTFGNGTMTTTFTSLSPVAFVVDKGTTAASTTSPKTSASSTTGIALLGLCAVVAAFGLKKKSTVR